jgi:drug/metabolite transporter (DMT)-like permease
MTRSRETTGVTLAVLAALCFSAKAILIKLAYPYGVGPLALLTLRMAFALPVFLVVAFQSSRGAPALSLRDWGALAGLGLVGYYAAALLDFWGLLYITAGLERLILFSYPTLTWLASVLRYQQPVERRDLVALGLTWLGVSLAFVHDLEIAGEPSAVWTGALYVLASAICYALYLVGCGQLVHRLGSLRLSALATAISSAAVFLHFALSQPLQELAQPPEVLGLAAAMGILSTVLPVFMNTAAIHRLGASRAAMIGTLGPIATIGLAAVFLEEPFSLTQSLGAALVIAGVSQVGRSRSGSVPYK